MIRPYRPAPHLFKHWSRVAACVHGSRRIILFLDFDGTLVRIAPRPNQVRFAPGVRRVLGRLARHPRVTVAVISGRRRGELTRHVAIRNVHYLGLYGWERNNRSSLSASASSAIKRAHGVLSRHLAGYPGVWIEDKGKSLSVHLLAAKPEIQRRVRQRIRNSLRALRKTLRIFENLRDIEIVPLAIRDKGSAVRVFLSKGRFPHAFPIYFGDDLSDEPAFAAVGRGISILVGKARRTRARFRLRGPAEVAAALSRLEAALA